MSRSPQRLGRGGRSHLLRLAVGSPVLALTIAAGASAATVVKSTPTPWIEPQDQAIYDLAYSNDSEAPVAALDLIDVLPRAGDVRGAGSAFHGTATLRSVVPAAPADVVSYTSTPPADVSSNPGDPSNVAGTGSTIWCTSVELGTAGCPADVAAATAVRIVRAGPVASGEGGTARIVLDTAGNQSGDRYVNDAGLCAFPGGGGGNNRVATRDADGGVCGGSQIPAVYADPVTVQVVASNLGDFVWSDSNRNGIQDAGEPGIPDVLVRLTGTDKDGNAVDRTVTTDANGRYTFAAADGHFTLRSGSYQLTFSAKPGYDFTVQGAGSDRGLDSDADPLTGRTQTITIPSPIANGVDGEDLTWDAGLVLPLAAVVPAPVPAAPTQHALSIRKRASRTTVRAGHRVAYTLTVRASRRGTEDAVGERVCDSLPKHLSLVSKGGGSLRNGRLCWRIARLAPGRTVVHRFVARVDRDTRAGRITNTATVTDQGRSRTARRSIRVLPARPRQAAAGAVTG